MIPSVEQTQFSDCRKYRYTLRRTGLVGTKRVCFVMLNPSTANAQIDDPTTRRAGAFATRFHCKEYLAVNLFALRSTDPKFLKSVYDPIGPENDRYLLAAAEWADEIVVAWGAGGTYLDRDKRVIELLSGHRLWCLGRTKHGHPKFPLYIAGDAQFEIFRDRADNDIYCSCEYSDAWRCAKSRNLSTIACHCRCHTAVHEDKKSHEPNSDRM